ncbi:hypothetical protein JKP88DRAFT_298552 [Tribonema minus]|uniref:R3H domain-containing protein n=1 Tax=Tribonema minus TaxID=303371 RepID=A0A835ZH94_9STRA|nr:hypothetical protein JKP88DRAFT_298552 [Tribonema minus]
MSMDDALNVLKFEDKIVRFMKLPREQRLEFPPLSGFHRLLVHRLAIRFGLEHQALESIMGMTGLTASGQQGGTYDSASSRDFCPMVLTKTAHCCVPKVLLIDISDSQAASAAAGGSAPPAAAAAAAAAPPAAVQPKISTPVGSSGKKIMLMRRDPQNALQAKSAGTLAGPTRQLSVAEKEKARATCTLAGPDAAA